MKKLICGIIVMTIGWTVMPDIQTIFGVCFVIIGYSLVSDASL